MMYLSQNCRRQLRLLEKGDGNLASHHTEAISVGQGEEVSKVWLLLWREVGVDLILGWPPVCHFEVEGEGRLL